jgi:hypothetical protein
MIIFFVEIVHQYNGIKNILVGWWVEDKRVFGKNDGHKNTRLLLLLKIFHQ